MTAEPAATLLWLATAGYFDDHPESGPLTLLIHLFRTIVGPPFCEPAPTFSSVPLFLPVPDTVFVFGLSCANDFPLSPPLFWTFPPPGDLRSHISSSFFCSICLIRCHSSPYRRFMDARI